MSKTESVRRTELDLDQMSLFATCMVRAGDGDPPSIESGTFELLHKIVTNVNRFRSVEQRLDVLLRSAMQCLPAAQQGALYLATASEHIFVIGALAPARPDRVGTEMNAQGGYVDAVAQVGCPVLLSDLQREVLKGHQEATEADLGIQSALVIPFVVGGRTVGILSLENCERTGAFTNQDLDLASLICSYTAMVIDGARQLTVRPSGNGWQIPELDVIQALAQWVPAGVLIVDSSRHHVWGNPALCNMIGFAQEELDRNLPCIHRSLSRNPFALAPEPGIQHRELTLTRCDKTHCRVQATLISLTAMGLRHVEGYVAILEDLTRQSQLEREFVRMQRLSNMGTLLSGVLYELNNPLTAVVGFAELLLSREDLSIDIGRDLETISRQAKRSVSVLHEVLDYLQYDLQEPVEVDMNRLIRQLARFRACDLDAESPQIELELCESLPPVLGNLQPLQHVLLNLIGSAEETARSAGKPCRLWIGTGKSENQVHVWVRDNEAGIPLAAPPCALETWAPQAGFEWAGLGLTICQQIVQHYHGHIWCMSQPDQGSTFLIELPAARSSSQHESVLTSLPTVTLPASILVIDDETSISKLLTKVLTRTGHHVDVALEGQDGLSKLQENVYDIVFLDLKIPGLSGKAIYEWIKKNQAALLERTVVLTGDTLNKDTMAFLEQEQVDYLLKPFQLVDLQNMLKRVWPPDRPGTMGQK